MEKKDYLKLILRATFDAGYEYKQSEDPNWRSLDIVPNFENWYEYYFPEIFKSIRKEADKEWQKRLEGIK